MLTWLLTWLLDWLAVAFLAVGMTYSRWTPGSCCGCDACVILTGFDSDDWTGSGWSFDGQDATGSGHAETTATASAATMQASVRIGSTIGSGQSVRVMVQVTDEDDYLYAECEYASPTTVTLRVGSRTSGSDTVLASTTIGLVAEGNELWACYTDGTLIATIGYRSVSAAASAKSGRKAGIDAVASETLEAFSFANRDGDCPVCYESRGPCSVCLDDAVPRYLSFTISGVGDTSPSVLCKTEFDCLGFGDDSGCEALNGTWILQHASGCEYQGARGPECFANATCFSGQPYTPMIRSAIINNDGSYGLQLNIVADHGVFPDQIQRYYEWRSGGTDDLDCMSVFAGKTLVTKTTGSTLYCDYPSTITCNGAA